MHHLSNGPDSNRDNSNEHLDIDEDVWDCNSDNNDDYYNIDEDDSYINNDDNDDPLYIHDSDSGYDTDNKYSCGEKDGEKLLWCTLPPCSKHGCQQMNLRKVSLIYREAKEVMSVEESFYRN